MLCHTNEWESGNRWLKYDSQLTKMTAYIKTSLYVRTVTIWLCGLKKPIGNNVGVQTSHHQKLSNRHKGIGSNEIVKDSYIRTIVSEIGNHKYSNSRVSATRINIQRLYIWTSFESINRNKSLSFSTNKTHPILSSFWPKTWIWAKYWFFVTKTEQEDRRKRCPDESN